MRVALLCLLACACEHDPHGPPQQSACLVDSLPPLHLEWEERPECTATNLACRTSCAAGDANACFNRALSLERSPDTADEATELFGRACRLGLGTGCTNWAASHWARDFDDTPDECLYRTFERTCAIDDPFGCGMAARILINEHLGLASLARGRFELEIACTRLGAFPCRVLAAYIERGWFGVDERSRIPALMAHACSGGDANACGDHATVEETFQQ